MFCGSRMCAVLVVLRIVTKFFLESNSEIYVQ
jgi:hypothetical protein